MKKFILPIMLISGMATFNACGTTSGSANASNGSLLGDAIAGAVAQNGNNTTGETLGNLLGQLLNNSSTLTQDDLVGTWKYQSPDCVFESENLLAKAGGEVAAQKSRAGSPRIWQKSASSGVIAPLPSTRTTPTALSSVAEPSTATTRLMPNTKPSR